jgi:hypothetical protein
MKGWELKPLGAIVLVTLLILLIYGGYILFNHYQRHKEDSSNG